jgi:hypothetical protein
MLLNCLHYCSLVKNFPIQIVTSTRPHTSQVCVPSWVYDFYTSKILNKTGPQTVSYTAPLQIILLVNRNRWTWLLEHTVIKFWLWSFKWLKIKFIYVVIQYTLHHLTSKKTDQSRSSVSTMSIYSMPDKRLLRWISTVSTVDIQQLWYLFSEVDQRHCEETLWPV